MKNFLLVLISIIFLLSLSTGVSSCKKDDLRPGIVYTDYPPQELFTNGITYGESYKCWVEGEDFKKATERGNGCNENYDHYTGAKNYYDCGVWRTVMVRKVYGIMKGIIYLSESKSRLLISPDNYNKGRDIADKKITVIGYNNTSQTPFGQVETIVGFE